jgi:MFS transporter, FSR family, fosmidomycin resistance protein
MLDSDRLSERSPEASVVEADPDALTGRLRLDRRGMAVLSASHLSVDICQGAVPALLPFLIARGGFNYATASALVLAATLGSTVIQPLFGHYSDRFSAPWLMPTGVLLACAGIAFVGISPGYAWTFGAVMLSGIGVAAFHPEGSRFANYVSGVRRATGMSVFSLGGNLGFALGPALTTVFVLAFGLSGTLLFLVLPTIVATTLMKELHRLRRFRPQPEDTSSTSANKQRDLWRPFTWLTTVIAFRSFVYFGLVTFIPLYFGAVLKASKAMGNTAVTVMLIGGAVGTILGGRLADKAGRKPVLIVSMASIPILVAAFELAGQPLATVLIFLVGLATVATFSVTVVMGQEFLPNHIGIASGVTLGLAIGLGGLSAPLFGLIADTYGLQATVAVMATLPLFGLVMALKLPASRSRALS